MADMQSVRDDIAFMRALAEEGRTAPLLSGRVMMASGVIYGLASLAHYTVAAGIVVVTPWAFPAIWFGATLVFLAVMIAIKSRQRAVAGWGSAGNRAMRGVWSGVGWGIFALGTTFGIAANMMHDAVVMQLFPSTILVLYGAGWILGAKMSEQRWMTGIAALCFLIAIGIAFLLGKPELYLAYAVAMGLTALLPGFLLVRQEPSDIV